MIGISFYLNDPLAEQRLTEAAGKGVTNAFTSLHIPEESGELANRAKQLLQLAKDLGVHVYADVSMRTPGHLGLNDLSELRSLGVVGLRLDDFFDYETIIELSQQFQIALNASIVLERDLLELLLRGFDTNQLIAWHNFYPRKETGLDEAFFQKQTELYKRHDIRVAAFVAGRGEKRGPLLEGLPTLESHRSLDPFHATIELFSAGIDDVYVGDPEPGEGLLEQLVAYDQNRIIPIRIHSGAVKSGVYRPRPDFARDVMRFMDTRSSESIPPDDISQVRPRGTVTRDNDLYGRYRGELHITLHDLAADERVNVVGSVAEADLHLLDLIQPGQLVYLECTEE
ncbi:MupG family TIM beta-alpha barrel fold protein [Brevibacillus sp. SYSU BS000544]|uniref:MupG family TIM beta-alpha barrel fold protein n=1 Tax=Brevibacillus sp. SYSU BS000544 TaxID=3416443 RepID=UPI003CE479EF